MKNFQAQVVVYLNVFAKRRVIGFFQQVKTCGRCTTLSLVALDCASRGQIEVFLRRPREISYGVAGRVEIHPILWSYDEHLFNEHYMKVTPDFQGLAGFKNLRGNWLVKLISHLGNAWVKRSRVWNRWGVKKCQVSGDQAEKTSRHQLLESTRLTSVQLLHLVSRELHTQLPQSLGEMALAISRNETKSWCKANDWETTDRRFWPCALTIILA